MSDKDRIDLAKYRMEKAEQLLYDAQLLLQAERYASSNNRAYYSIFTAMRAVLALDKVEFRKHSGNIQYFLKEYVKTGIFEASYSEIILSASKIRNDSDYNDFYVLAIEDAVQQVGNADIFLAKVKDYIREREEQQG